MDKPLELLERQLMQQAPVLIERSMTEGDPKSLIPRVRRVVLLTASLGEDARQFIYNSTPWKVFLLMNPEAAGKIMAEAKLGIVADEDQHIA